VSTVTLAALGGCASTGFERLSSIGGDGGNDIFHGDLFHGNRSDYLGLGAAGDIQDGALPAGLLFDRATGQVVGAAAAPFPPTQFKVMVSDGVTKTSPQTFVLSAVAPPSTSALTTTPVLSGITLTQNVPTVITPVSASGGKSPLKLALTGGTLPAGLVFFDSSGQISGTPSAVLAPTLFTITVTDSTTPAAATGSVQFQLAVIAAPTAGALTAQPAIIPSMTLTQYQTVEFRPIIGGGGAGPVTYSLAATPADILDRMYDQAQVSCLYYKNEENNFAFIGDEGFNAVSFALAATAPVLIAARTRAGTATAISAVVALFPTQVKSLVGDVTGIHGGSETKDYTTTKNLIDTVHNIYTASASVQADLANGSPATIQWVQKQYRLGLEQACLSASGITSPAPSSGGTNAAQTSGAGNATPQAKTASGG